MSWEFHQPELTGTSLTCSGVIIRNSGHVWREHRSVEELYHFHVSPLCVSWAQSHWIKSLKLSFSCWSDDSSSGRFIKTSAARTQSPRSVSAGHTGRMWGVDDGDKITQPEPDGRLSWVFLTASFIFCCSVMLHLQLFAFWHHSVSADSPCSPSSLPDSPPLTLTSGNRGASYKVDRSTDGRRRSGAVTWSLNMHCHFDEEDTASGELQEKVSISFFVHCRGRHGNW